MKEGRIYRQYVLLWISDQESYILLLYTRRDDVDDSGEKSSSTNGKSPKDLLNMYTVAYILDRRWIGLAKRR